MFFSSLSASASSKSASSLASGSNRCFKCTNSLILTVFALVLVFIRPRVDGLFGKKKFNFVLMLSLMIRLK